MKMKGKTVFVRGESPCLTLSLLFLAVCVLLGAPAAEGQDPPRLKRADSFLGIHFDFHAGEDCTEVGKNTTPAMVENIIDLVHPDYLQIDCKGHRRPVELPDQGRPSSARLCGRSAACLAGGHGPAWRRALHALLGRVGFQSHRGTSGLGRGRRRRQHQRTGPRRSSAPTPRSY